MSDSQFFVGDITLADGDTRTLGLDRTALSENTASQYQASWSVFAEFCDLEDLCPFPAEPSTLEAFWEHLTAGANPRAQTRSTLESYRAAITTIHRQNGANSPVRKRGLYSYLGIYKHLPNRECTATLVPVIRPSDLRHWDQHYWESRNGTPYPGPAAHRINEKTRILREDPKFLRDRALVRTVLYTDLSPKHLVALHLVNRTASRIKLGSHGSTVSSLTISREDAVDSLAAWLDLKSDGESPLFCSLAPTGNLTGQRLEPTTVANLIRTYTGYSRQSLREGHRKMEQLRVLRSRVQ